MKKTESLCDFGFRIWDFKAAVLEEVPKSRVEDLLERVNEELKAFGAENEKKLNARPKLKDIALRVRKKVSNRIGIKAIHKHDKGKMHKCNPVDKHFQELDSQLLHLSQGKISLNSVNIEKALVVHIETLPSQAFDLDSRFTESVKSRLLQLKLKDDYLNQQKFTKFKKKHIPLTHLAKSFSSKINFQAFPSQLVSRNAQISTTFPLFRK